MTTSGLKPTPEELAEQSLRRAKLRARNLPFVETATLRDLLAGFALIGIVVRSYSSELSPNEMAVDAYGLADAMLESRIDS